ncbi:hypothetical protein HMPREF3036_02362 [Sutterella sp. KLE1602]|nr:hypothetical protein HMPREF3036_02362 [Sutterella sp. KLE1602]
MSRTSLPWTFCWTTFRSRPQFFQREGVVVRKVCEEHIVQQNPK